MTEKRTWFIAGARRGMGVEFARAALAAGNAVVATGRDPDTIRAALGENDDLLVAQLDVTRPDDAEAAVKAAVDRAASRPAPAHGWGPDNTPGVAKLASSLRTASGPCRG